jgi:hypothetical protein
MKYISNCGNFIDWDSVLLELKDKPGITLRYNEQTFNKNLKGFDQLAREWEQAGYVYNDSAIEWVNYFPGSDFSNNVVEQFGSIVNAKPWMIWISKIRPGRMAPWHFDAHSKIDELVGKDVVRYTCYIQKPTFGHVSIVEDVCVYRPNQGDIYQWPSYDSYHCGMNGGYTDKYMFNFWGYQ